MSDTVYICTIPAVAPSLNEWRKWHWAKQSRERKAFQEMAWAVLNEKGNKAPRGLEAVEIHAVLMFREDRRRDSDNFGAVLAKWLQDSLTQLGIIPDDTADRCTFYPPKIVKGDKALTLITIEGRRTA